jgi:hypothetical protein
MQHETDARLCSHGQITITSDNPFARPSIDPRYLTHFAGKGYDGDFAGTLSS